ncbi:MAG: response regulator, partial [Nannocystaceae bacterium]|nr:response regulator [Nannocystaceae bacterium]
ERVIRRLARVTLERAGFEVLEACDGVEAVRVFRANVDRVGVVLLDSMMPNLAGAEVLSKIREMRPGQPVVVSSGYACEVDSPVGERPTAFLPKPWCAEELICAIQGAVRRQSSE